MKNIITNPTMSETVKFAADMAEMIDVKLVPHSPAWVAAVIFERRALARISEMARTVAA